LREAGEGLDRGGDRAFRGEITTHGVQRDFHERVLAEAARVGLGRGGLDGQRPGDRGNGRWPESTTCGRWGCPALSRNWELQGASSAVKVAASASGIFDVFLSGNTPWLQFSLLSLAQIPPDRAARLFSAKSSLPGANTSPRARAPTGAVQLAAGCERKSQE
jgi:hypothetical protein